MTSNVTVVSSLLGGVLIGLSASALLMLTGRVAGISGIVGGLVQKDDSGPPSWRLAFLSGLFLGGLALLAMRPSTFASPDTEGMSPLLVALAAVFVGVGTTIGNGCTSGHGVCGISRFSKRSIVATMTFMGVAIVVTFVMRHVIGGTGR